jgi:photosystem II stability/assembly factor-like uncharacterized protein
MTKKVTLGLLLAFLVGATVSVMYWQNDTEITPKTQLSSLEELAAQRQIHKRKFSYIKPMGSPHKYLEIFKQARTGPGETEPSYPHSYRTIELQKLSAQAKVARTEGTDDITWTERGPGNVPGRTLVIVVDTDDATGNTWFAGAASGGIWKTIDAGTTWTEISGDMNNLNISTMVMAPSNSNVIYVGTGEGSFQNGSTSGNGSGIFKSIDKGLTWTQLASTTDASSFANVTRLVVDPSDENVVVVSTVSPNMRDFPEASGIYRSTDGGSTWTNTFSMAADEFDRVPDVQTLVTTPGNFNVQYASINGLGVIKSVDGGQTWGDVTPNATFGSTIGRMELAVANDNTDIVYAGVQSAAAGSTSALFISQDAGVTWILVNDTASDGNPADWFASGGAGDQGWYDNTIVVHPYNDFAVYVGGINLFRIDVGAGTSFTEGVLGVIQDKTDEFMGFTNFGQTEFGGALALGEDISEDQFVSVEFRFGTDKKQMAHRFEVPAAGGAGFDGGAGVPDDQYAYKDYIEVPFEVWDITNNKQLMVSFRDQQRDGGFNLNPRDDDNDPDLLTSREYLFVHAIDYDANEPSSAITKDGGHIQDNMYFIWPVYIGAGATWDSSTQTDATLRILYGERTVQQGASSPVTDAQGQRFDGRNNNVHVDHHFLTTILNGDGENFRLLNGNDGGVYVSDEGTNPATKSNAWTMVGLGFNTSQFYGADKQAGEDTYLGGTQDNGTWSSRNVTDVSASSEYTKFGGGDGFEVLSHATDKNKAIGSVYNNFFYRTVNGFQSSTTITSGFNDNGPFISRLANSPLDPDLIHTYGSSGPWYSTNFGSFWRSSTIDTDTWLFGSLTDIESSLANADIVWTGGYMGTFRGDPYHVHVSVDGGKNYTAVNDFGEVGATTSLATHPFDAETAYVMFSSHNNPKVLRTTDLGQTWEDISGFAGSTTGSTNGFPDVVVNSLIVLPHEPNTIWVGTEIGIVESNDNGVSWHMLDSELPPVSVWTMKVVDDQVVIGTHGRGIWTATIPELLDVTGPSSVLKPVIVSLAQAGSELKIASVFDLRDTYDDTDVVVNGAVYATIPANSTKGEINYNIDVTAGGTYVVQLKSHKGGEEVVSEEVSITIEEFGSATASYSNDLSNGGDDFALFGFRVGSETGFTSDALHSDHPYIEASEVDGAPESISYTAVLKTPIIISADNPFMSYRDVAIVEKGDVGKVFGEQEFWDYVVVEGSLDGENWTPIEDGYDANANTTWGVTYDAGVSGDESMYVSHKIDLSSKFSAGQEVFIRFHLFSDALTVGWGWTIDDIEIQTDAVGLNDAKIAQFVSVFPNPTDSEVNLRIENVLNGDLKVSVYNTNGQRVFTKEVRKDNSIFEMPIDFSQMAAGSYVVEVINGTERITKKVIRTK